MVLVFFIFSDRIYRCGSTLSSPPRACSEVDRDHLQRALGFLLSGRKGGPRAPSSRESFPCYEGQSKGSFSEGDYGNLVRADIATGPGDPCHIIPTSCNARTSRSNGSLDDDSSPFWSSTSCTSARLRAAPTFSSSSQQDPAYGHRHLRQYLAFFQRTSQLCPSRRWRLLSLCLCNKRL